MLASRPAVVRTWTWAATTNGVDRRCAMNLDLAADLAADGVPQWLPVDDAVRAYGAVGGLRCADEARRVCRREPSRGGGRGGASVERGRRVEEGWRRRWGECEPAEAEEAAGFRGRRGRRGAGRAARKGRERGLGRRRSGDGRWGPESCIDRADGDGRLIARGYARGLLSPIGLWIAFGLL
ncbi:uncharacterized protein A4U43_C05F25240 [Asparagus officinalis]|uniref:Uncharacterized protein n=1 Tax=Asparagus officinalis TaxID=4686 RepID=A0A5P1EUD0_ASPOF|nr:uncharacterized protein A4U43_C05F25240 [Asparagus officinalis]